MRRVRYFLLFVGLSAIGGAALARPAVSQEPSTPLANCPPGSGETLDGSVVDRATNVPLADANIAVSRAGRTRNSRSTADGRFRFCGIGGSERLDITAQYASVSSEPLSVTGGNRGQPVRVEIDLGAPSIVVVSVTDADSGEPIQGVTLRLEPGVIGAVTNEAGSAGLGRVPPGDYRLRADHLAFGSFSGTVFIMPDQPRQLDIRLASQIIALDTLTVTIEAGDCVREGFTTLSGRVIDRRSKIPLKDAVVSLSRFESGAFFDERAQTGEDGSFVLCGVPDDTRYRLQASLGALRSDGVSIHTGRTRGAIVLEIDHGEPAFLVVRVTDASTGFPVEGAMMRLRPHPLAGITDEKGLTGFPKVPPGEYEVRVDHIAYASFEATMQVRDGSAEEFEIGLQPTALTLAPLEVRITGRDPILINTGFYDRMAELDEGFFYDYWDAEPYGHLGTFIGYKTFMVPTVAIFVNGRPFERLGYRSLRELPMQKIRGVEHIRCADLPPDHARYFDDFAIHAAKYERGHSDCWALLIWRGDRRVRTERDKPTDRCANERRAEELCSKEEER